MDKITLFTIGFTKKTAQQFFSILRTNGVKRIIDIRLNNVSQLAGFTKRDDLRFFLRELCNADYLHRPECAPTKSLLEKYKKQGQIWEDYVSDFIPIITHRKVEDLFDLQTLDHACLLCSEPLPENCHRLLVSKYLRNHYPSIEIKHV